MLCSSTYRAATVVALSLAFAAPLYAQTVPHDHAHDHAHDHTHDHGHGHVDDKAAARIADGYFEDAQIKPRALSDWAGDWQSAHVLLADGSLDPVMAHKAKDGEKTAEEQRAYYETAYKTDVTRLEIKGDTVTFHRAGGANRASYANDGYEVLTYDDGHRGVRFFFRKMDGDADAPGFIAFSDHLIAPQKADHYHLYSGNDRAALAKRGPNWPTYYPAAMSGPEVAAEMMAH